MSRKDWDREEERNALALSPKKRSDGCSFWVPVEGDYSYGSRYQFGEMIGVVLGTSGDNQKIGVSLLIDSNETLMRTFVEIVPYPILGGGPEDRALEMWLEKNKEQTGFLLFCFNEVFKTYIKLENFLFCFSSVNKDLEKACLYIS